MNKRYILPILSGVLFVSFSMEANATKTAIGVAQKLVNIFRLARATSGNGLTELPSSRLRDHGARFVSEFEDILSATVARVGGKRTIRELPGSTTDRNIREFKEDWDACLKKSDKDLKQKARNANTKIQKMKREYDDLLKPEI